MRRQSGAVPDRAQFVLLELPVLLRELLDQAIGAHGNCDTYTIGDSAALDPRENTLHPTAVIIGLTAATDAAIVPALLTRWPRAQVVTVAEVGRELVHYRMTVERHALGPLSPTELVSMLHEQTGGPGGR
jgi:hypothetical protein